MVPAFSQFQVDNITDIFTIAYIEILKDVGTMLLDSSITNEHRLHVKHEFPKTG